MTIYDGTFSGGLNPAAPLFPARLAGTTKCVNLGLVNQVRAADPSLTWPAVFARAVWSFQFGGPLPVNTGGGVYNAPIADAPVGLYQMDNEGMAGLTLPVLADAVVAILAAWPNARLTQFEPDALFGVGGDEQNRMKKPGWSPDPAALAAGRAYRKRNAGFYDRLWAISLKAYFQRPAIDAEVFTKIRNDVLMARMIYGKSRRILVHTAAHRETVAGEPSAEPEQLDRWAGFLNTLAVDPATNVAGVIVWGNTQHVSAPGMFRLLAALGVEGAGLSDSLP